MAEYLSDIMVTTLTDFEEAAVEKTADAIKKNPPSMWWMQIILATLQPDHEVFDPLYMPPNPYVQNRLPEPKVANIDNFYEASMIP